MKKALVGMALAATLLASGCGEPTNLPVESTVDNQNTVNLPAGYIPIPTPTASPTPNPTDAFEYVPRTTTVVRNSAPRFTLVQNPRIVSEGYGGFVNQYIVGVLKYNGSKQLSYVSVTCQVYDRGVQIADGLGNASGLQPYAQWRFRALMTETVDQYDNIVCQADGHSW